MYAIALGICTAGNATQTVTQAGQASIPSAELQAHPECSFLSDGDNALLKH